MPSGLAVIPVTDILCPKSKYLRIANVQTVYCIEESYITKICCFTRRNKSNVNYYFRLIVGKKLICTGRNAKEWIICYRAGLQFSILFFFFNYSFQNRSKYLKFTPYNLPNLASELVVMTDREEFVSCPATYKTKNLFYITELCLSLFWAMMHGFFTFLLATWSDSTNTQSFNNVQCVIFSSFDGVGLK